MLPSYFMSRYSTDIFYTFEFIVCITILCILIFFAKKSGEKKSLYVYLVTGFLHSIIELIAEGVGNRVISETYLFSVIYLTYPFLPFILGFFEGGLYCLLAYHFVRYLMNRDRFSLKFFLSFTIVFLTFISLGAMRMQSDVLTDPLAVTFTRRALLSISTLILYTVFYIVSIGYFLLNKRVTSRHRLSFFYFYIGLIVVTALMVIPLHLAGIRFIEYSQNGSYFYASIPEQILVLYGYSLAIEAAGIFIPYYVIIYHFNLIQINPKLN